MTILSLELESGESLVPAGDELLYRQITRFLASPDGRPGTHAFGPQDADRGKPSFSRSSLVSAQESRDWHDGNCKNPSLGVWAVSVDEVIAARTVAIDDSGVPLQEGERRSPGHCYVDYRGLERRVAKTVRAKLWMAAVERDEVPTTAPGVLFGAPTT